MPLTPSLAPQFAALGSVVDTALASLAASIPPVSTVPQPIVAGSGRNYVIDPRDFGARVDGVSDDTLAIQAALQAATNPSNPRVVHLVSGSWLTGPLHYPGPGVYLRGEGYMGLGRVDGPCTVLAARNAADSGPLLSMDASLMPGHQWARNCGLEGVAFDVSRASRFQTAAPPPVLSFLGVSNIQSLRRLVVYGNRGTAFYVGTNPAVETAWSENVDFYECGCYGGFLPDASYSPNPPAGPMVKFSGTDRVKFHGGLIAYGCSSLPLPVHDDMSDVPAFHITPELRPSGTGVNAGIGSGIFGTAIANLAVTVRVSVVDWGNTVYGPAALSFEDLVVENFHTGFQIGMEPVKLTPAWARSGDIQIRRCRFGGSDGWFHMESAHTIMANNILGGEFHVPFLGKDGDVTLGPATHGVRVIVGPNPNGYVYRGVSLGVNNEFSYLD